MEKQLIDLMLEYSDYARKENPSGRDVGRAMDIFYSIGMNYCTPLDIHQYATIRKALGLTDWSSHKHAYY